MQGEEKGDGLQPNSLQNRLKPKNMAQRGLKMGKTSSSMASSAPLKPRGLVGSASAMTLHSQTLGKKDVKASLAFEERGLARSQSAAILARRPNSPLDPSLTNKSSAFGESGGPFAVSPPIPGDNESDTKKLGSFLDSLGLSAADIHALHHVPNTFFYMRMKGFVSGTTKDTAAVETMKTTAAKEALQDTANNQADQERKEQDGELVEFSEVEGSEVNLKVSLPDNSVDKLYDRVSVYDLEVVDQDLIDKEHYFTLSKEGVTIYKDRSSQFTTMKQWEREYMLFNKIKMSLQIIE